MGVKHSGASYRQETIRERFPMGVKHSGASYRQETIRERFPMGVKHSGASCRQETIGEGFPIGLTHSCLPPDRKLDKHKNPLQCGEDFLLYFTDYRPNLAKISSTCFSMGL